MQTFLLLLPRGILHPSTDIIFKYVFVQFKKLYCYIHPRVINHIHKQHKKLIFNALWAFFNCVCFYIVFTKITQHYEDNAHLLFEAVGADVVNLCAGRGGLKDGSADTVSTAKYRVTHVSGYADPHRGGRGASATRPIQRLDTRLE